MKKSNILLVDSLVNLLLGLLLLFYPRGFIELLGIPLVKSSFYPSILGSVLIGIAIALFVEWNRKRPGYTGLGIAGAIIINLFAALVLSVWLLFGSLEIPLRGILILWGLAVLVIVIALIEIMRIRKT